jgi:shikimate O-hydroxycinnamoyltransferase
MFMSAGLASNDTRFAPCAFLLGDPRRKMGFWRLTGAPIVRTTFCEFRKSMARLRSTLMASKRLHAGVTVPKQYLTGVDILHGHVGVPLFYLYKKGFDVAVAERALSDTLKHYPFVAGRIKKDAQGHVYVDGQDAGVEFNVYRCEGAMPYGEHQPVGDDVNQFFKRLMPFQVIDKDTPLFQANVYQYADGGIVLCVRMVHSIFDGTSFYGLMLDWSKVCRGLEIKSPSFDRSVMIKAGQADIDPAGYDMIYQPSVVKTLSMMARLGWRMATDMEKEIFRIPAEAVHKWKAEAKAVLPETARVSTGKLVTAYVLKTLSPLMPHGVPRRVGMAMDIRHIRGSMLPIDYFGNGLCYGSVEYTEQELAQSNLAVLAEKCQPPAEQTSAGAIAKVVTLLERYRQKHALWKLVLKPGMDTLDGGIVQNNLSNFPIYDVDMGRGTPDWYETFAMPVRMMALVSTPTKDGGIDVHMAACKAELKALREQLVADGIWRDRAGMR